MATRKAERCPVCKKGKLVTVPLKESPLDAERRPMPGKGCNKCGAYFADYRPKHAHKKGGA